MPFIAVIKLLRTCFNITHISGNPLLQSSGLFHGAADKKRRTLNSSSSSSSGPGVAMISGVVTSTLGVGAGAPNVKGVGGGSIAAASAS